MEVDDETVGGNAGSMGVEMEIDDDGSAAIIGDSASTPTPTAFGTQEPGMGYPPGGLAPMATSDDMGMYTNVGEVPAGLSSDDHRHSAFHPNGALLFSGPASDQTTSTNPSTVNEVPWTPGEPVPNDNVVSPSEHGIGCSSALLGSGNVHDGRTFDDNVFVPDDSNCVGMSDAGRASSPRTGSPVSDGHEAAVKDRDDDFDGTTHDEDLDEPTSGDTGSDPDNEPEVGPANQQGTNPHEHQPKAPKDSSTVQSPGDQQHQEYDDDEGAETSGDDDRDTNDSVGTNHDDASDSDIDRENQTAASTSANDHTNGCETMLGGDVANDRQVLRQTRDGHTVQVSPSDQGSDYTASHTAERPEGDSSLTQARRTTINGQLVANRHDRARPFGGVHDYSMTAIDTTPPPAIANVAGRIKDRSGSQDESSQSTDARQDSKAPVEHGSQGSQGFTPDARKPGLSSHESIQGAGTVSQDGKTTAVDSIPAGAQESIIGVPKPEAECSTSDVSVQVDVSPPNKPDPRSTYEHSSSGSRAGPSVPSTGLASTAPPRFQRDPHGEPNKPMPSSPSEDVTHAAASGVTPQKEDEPVRQVITPAPLEAASDGSTEDAKQSAAGVDDVESHGPQRIPAPGPDSKTPASEDGHSKAGDSTPPATDQNGEGHHGVQQVTRELADSRWETSPDDPTSPATDKNEEGGLQQGITREFATSDWETSSEGSTAPISDPAESDWEADAWPEDSPAPATDKREEGGVTDDSGWDTDSSTSSESSGRPEDAIPAGQQGKLSGHVPAPFTDRIADHTKTADPAKVSRATALQPSSGTVWPSTKRNALISTGLLATGALALWRYIERARPDRHRPAPPSTTPIAVDRTLLYTGAGATATAAFGLLLARQLHESRNGDVPARLKRPVSIPPGDDLEAVAVQHRARSAWALSIVVILIVGFASVLIAIRVASTRWHLRQVLKFRSHLDDNVVVVDGVL